VNHPTAIKGERVFVVSSLRLPTCPTLCRMPGQQAGKAILASGDIGPDAKLLEPDPEAPADSIM